MKAATQSFRTAVFTGPLRTDRLIRAASPMTIDGEVFAAEPRIRFSEIAIGGRAESESFTVTGPRDVYPFSLVDVPTRVPKLEVFVREVLADGTPAFLEHYGRLIGRAVAESNRALGVLTFGGIKAQLAQIDVGMRLTTTCPLELGGGICRAHSHLFRRNAQIGTIQNRTVELLNVDAPINADARVYQDGWIECQGLSLRMLRWTPATLTAELIDSVPADWLQKACVLHPGCGKLPSDCVFWDSLSDGVTVTDSFSGIGYWTSTDNPLTS